MANSFWGHVRSYLFACLCVRVQVGVGEGVIGFECLFVFGLVNRVMIFSPIIVKGWSSSTATCLSTATLWSGYSANQSSPKLLPEQPCICPSNIGSQCFVNSGNVTQILRYLSRSPNSKKTTAGLEWKLTYNISFHLCQLPSTPRAQSHKSHPQCGGHTDVHGPFPSYGDNKFEA